MKIENYVSSQKMWRICRARETLILFLQSAKEVLTGSSFKLAKVTIFGKSNIRVDKWQT